MEHDVLELALEALRKAMQGNLMFDEAMEAFTAINKALAQPAQEPEYWNVIDPAGNIVDTETNAIRGWARIPGSYKPTVEGLLGFHDQGWRVLPKINQIAQPAHSEWNAALDEAAARINNVRGFGQATQDSFAVFIKGLKKE